MTLASAFLHITVHVLWDFHQQHIFVVSVLDSK